MSDYLHHHPEQCAYCDGLGYVLRPEARTDIPNGWIVVEVCDECGRFADDSHASQEASWDLGGVAWAFWYAQDHYLGVDDPGDYAIEVYVSLDRWAA